MVGCGSVLGGGWGWEGRQTLLHTSDQGASRVVCSSRVSHMRLVQYWSQNFDTPSMTSNSIDLRISSDYEPTEVLLVDASQLTTTGISTIFDAPVLVACRSLIVTWSRIIAMEMVRSITVLREFMRFSYSQ